MHVDQNFKETVWHYKHIPFDFLLEHNVASDQLHQGLKLFSHGLKVANLYTSYWLRKPLSKHGKIAISPFAPQIQLISKA